MLGQNSADEIAIVQLSIRNAPCPSTPGFTNPNLFLQLSYNSNPIGLVETVIPFKIFPMSFAQEDVLDKCGCLYPGILFHIFSNVSVINHLIPT